MIFALAGNQNCGKTTLFNQLTGSNQHVGNFPGVTVDQKSGPVRGQKDCTVVDLPGIYSLRPYTAEEIVTRDFILKNKPDGIINIVDATNLERNLYLTLQLLTLRVPTVLALNMMDELTGNGGSIDTDKLSQQLGVPVVPICAASGDGVEALIETAVRTAEEKRLPAVVDFCAPGPVHRCIHAVCHQIEDHAQRAGLSVRFAATWVIDGDEAVLEQLHLDQNEKELEPVDITDRAADTADEVRVRVGAEVKAFKPVVDADGIDCALGLEHGEIPIDGCERQIGDGGLELGVDPFRRRVARRAAQTFEDRVALMAVPANSGHRQDSLLNQY